MARRLGAVPLMLLASGLFSVTFAMVKALGPTFPATEAAFFRSLLSLPLMAVLVWRAGGRAAGPPRAGAEHVRHSLRPAQPGLMVLRGVLGACAMFGFFFALPRGKLADLMLIGRTQPLLITLLSRLLLRERTPRLALVSLGVGFAGAFLVIRPGFGWLNVAGLVALGAVVLSALAHLTVRRLNATETPLVIVFYFTLIVGTCSGLLSLPVFVAPGGRQWLLLLALAQSAAGGQLLMTTAYGRDTAPVVATSAYASVVYALIIGYVFWNELPDGLAVVGGALIVVAGVVLAYGRRGVLVPPPGSSSAGGGHPPA